MSIKCLFDMEFSTVLYYSLPFSSVWCHTNFMWPEKQRPDFCSLLTNILVIYCCLYWTQLQQVFMMISFTIKALCCHFSGLNICFIYKCRLWFDPITIIKPGSRGVQLNRGRDGEERWWETNKLWHFLSASDRKASLPWQKHGRRGDWFNWFLVFFIF